MSAAKESDALRLLREVAPQVLGAVTRRCGDFSAAEDAVQEALIAAAAQWPRAGVPDNPRGWLYQVAMRRLADYARSDEARRRREQESAPEPFVAPADDALGVERDDTLVLLYMCCHPALTPASAVALTLRAVGGLTTREIAAGFLVPEATMAQRISRAKQTVKASGASFDMPAAPERDARTASVLQVLYLMFNEGYTSSEGPNLSRPDLSAEAIRLTRTLRALLPTDREAAALLALMLLTDARRAARSGPNGELIPLDEQDRGLWDAALIADGTRIVHDLRGGGAAGAYELQAAIAALHDAASGTAETDWRQIRALYDGLIALTDNPMASLARAVAVAMVEGPAAGLAAIDVLAEDPRVRGHYRLDAVRGHLLAMAGDAKGAASHFVAAAQRTASAPERDYLLRKVSELVNPG